MNVKSREDISKMIASRLELQKDNLQKQFNTSQSQIGYFILDDVLPKDLAEMCYTAFPDTSKMSLKKSLREYKYVSAQMNEHHPLLEEVLYAFQNPKVVKLIEQVCDIHSLFPDAKLYAGGISLMQQYNFLNPHLDNSHDAERNRWRVLNLLYYVSPNWEKTHGGHLELWPDGPKGQPIEIESKFNRLVVMATHQKSWHSVNEVKAPSNRCCISNYYFSDNPLRESDNFHVTKFRGRPQSKLVNLALTLDSEMRMLIRKFFKKGIKKNPHVYKKEE